MATFGIDHARPLAEASSAQNEDASRPLLQRLSTLGESRSVASPVGSEPAVVHSVSFARGSRIPLHTVGFLTRILRNGAGSERPILFRSSMHGQMSVRCLHTVLSRSSGRLNPGSTFDTWAKPSRRPALGAEQGAFCGGHLSSVRRGRRAVPAVDEEPNGTPSLCRDDEPRAPGTLDTSADVGRESTFYDNPSLRSRIATLHAGRRSPAWSPLLAGFHHIRNEARPWRGFVRSSCPSPVHPFRSEVCRFPAQSAATRPSGGVSDRPLLHRAPH